MRILSQGKLPSLHHHPPTSWPTEKFEQQNSVTHKKVKRNRKKHHLTTKLKKRIVNGWNLMKFWSNQLVYPNLFQEIRMSSKRKKYSQNDRPSTSKLNDHQPFHLLKQPAIWKKNTSRFRPSKNFLSFSYQIFKCANIIKSKLNNCKDNVLNKKAKQDIRQWESFYDKLTTTTRYISLILCYSHLKFKGVEFNFTKMLFDVVEKKRKKKTYF